MIYKAILCLVILSAACSPCLGEEAGDGTATGTITLSGDTPVCGSLAIEGDITGLYRYEPHTGAVHCDETAKRIKCLDEATGDINRRLMQLEYESKHGPKTVLGWMMVTYLIVLVVLFALLLVVLVVAVIIENIIDLLKSISRAKQAWAAFRKGGM